MKIAPLIIISILFVPACSYTSPAQNPWIDSVKRQLITQPADTGKVYSLINVSNAYRFSYPDSSLLYAQQAEALAVNLQSDNALFWSIVSVTGALYILGNYTLELEYVFKLRALSKRLNTPYTVGYSIGLLSDCYQNLGEYDTSLKYWREVMKISEQLPHDRFRIYAGASRLFSAMHQYDSALTYAKMSYRLFQEDPLFVEESEDNKFVNSGLLTCLGTAFSGKGFYDSALYYYRMSIPFSDLINMGTNKMDAYNGIAEIYKVRKRADSAIWYAQKALQEKITKSYPIGMLTSATLLADIYKTKNNADSTLKYLLIFAAVKDSLFKREKTTAFQSMLFRDQEKQRDVEVVKRELKRQYRLYISIASSLVLLSIAVVVIRNRRIRQLQTIRNMIADDLHDDIGSTLSSISIMNELAKAKSPEALSLLTSIGENANTLQENMSDIVWTIKTGNDRFENVIQRMNRFANEILESKNIALDFTIEPSLAAAKLTMEQRKNFYLFFKEVINNAAKHSAAKNISVRILQKAHHIELMVRDDGKGFDIDKPGSGNGMGSLKKRATELNGHFTVSSCCNSGTEVQLKFKVA